MSDMIDRDAAIALYKQGGTNEGAEWDVFGVFIDAIRALPAVEVGVKPQLYLDCDGVLADFDASFINHFGHPPRDYENTKGSAVFWRDIQNDEDGFYRNLPLMPDARKLFDAVAHLRPIILTGCPMGGWAEAQKLAWAAEHFPGTPMVTCMSRDKRAYCKPGDILVDDLLRYRDRWESAGGIFIHHTSADASIIAIRSALTIAPAPALTVWYGSMPESNGKSNWTASLHRKGGDAHLDGFCFARSEYPDRARYEADRVRWVIGELAEKPDVLAYDADLHSGYVYPPAPDAGKVQALVDALEKIAEMEVFSMGIGIDPRPTQEAKIARAALTEIKETDHE